MISLCLQTCPVDNAAALELSALICDIEPERRKDTEFFLVYRKDTPRYVAVAFEAMAAKKFARSAARMARNHDEGWPAGSNMLAQSAFMEMEVLRREGLCKSEAFLLFEPDCVPLAADWIDQLSREWKKTAEMGREAFGHWHQQGDESTLHMNGNAVFSIGHFNRHPNLMIGAGTVGWDYFYRDQLIPLSRDSALVSQTYAWGTITADQFDALVKHGVRPAFLHGVKDGSARALARERLVVPSVAQT